MSTYRLSAEVNAASRLVMRELARRSLIVLIVFSALVYMIFSSLR